MTPAVQKGKTASPDPQPPLNRYSHGNAQLKPITHKVPNKQTTKLHLQNFEKLSIYIVLC